MNVLNFPEGQRPNPEPLFYLGSDSLPLCGLWFGTKATDVSPWYGVYLMQQQKLDEAISWLEKAKTAKRYEPRHFPYLNLGHIYAAKGMINKAIEEFRGALKFNPDDSLALRAIEELESKLQ